MKVIISIEHRISNGAEAVKFLQALACFLANLVRMLVLKANFRSHIDFGSF